MLSKVNKDNPIFVSFLLYFVPIPPAYFDPPPRLLIFQNPWRPPVYFEPPVYYEPEKILVTFISATKMVILSKINILSYAQFQKQYSRNCFGVLKTTISTLQLHIYHDLQLAPYDLVLTKGVFRFLSTIWFKKYWYNRGYGLHWQTSLKQTQLCCLEALGVLDL